jgi:flagellar biosynthesis/type III secretory pathway chaperone
MTTNALALLDDAIRLCQELENLLADENTHLRQRKTAFLEEGVRQKNRLAMRLENLLGDIRTASDAIKADPEGPAKVARLKDAMHAYDVMARQNVLLLQAAHTVTTDFLGMVRQALQKPQAKTYGASGTLQTKSAAGSTLVAKSV